MLSSSLSTTQGFHSVYSTQIIVDDPADIARCTVHLLHMFPPRVFVDPYELLNYKDFYTFRLSGTSNLELPVMAVDPEGSALLLNISFPRAFHGTQNVTVDVPLHIRYGELVQPRSPKTSDDGTVKVPWPTGFWACPSSSSRPFHPLPSMPANLAASFNSASHTFISIGMSEHTPSTMIQAPVGRLADLKQVEVATTIVILLGFLYLLHAAHSTASRMTTCNQHAKVE